MKVDIIFNLAEKKLNALFKYFYLLLLTQIKKKKNYLKIKVE